MRSIAFLGLVLALPVASATALAIERLECGGTEPFWSATLQDGRLTFKEDADPNSAKTYANPTYGAARGASEEYVLSFRAERGTSSVTGFVVNQELMSVADERGTSLRDTARAYCSDGMSDRSYPFSIHLFIDGEAFTGCCSTASKPPLEPK